jgi:hypothetical protein
MTHRKDAEPVRTTRESEIFRDPPGSGNYGSNIGAAQGIELFSGSGRVRRARPTKTVFEPARQVPVFAETDVLVVGGGPAGTAAAIAAARLGADVLLVERYNHLGGLSTGGLVIWIDRMTDWSGRHVIRGLAEELMERLPKDAIPPCLVGMEACATAHYWARELTKLGHQVRLMPAKDVKAYVKRNKNDAADATVRYTEMAPDRFKNFWKD